MSGIFTYRDEIEGKAGIGKLPIELQRILDDLSKEYDQIIPDKNASSYHTWYNDMPPAIKQKVEQIQQHELWNQLCDENKKCVRKSAKEMDELYYANPKPDFDKINLYGESGNYSIHKDCIYNFHGIKFYVIVIGLTDGNDSVTTYLNHFDVGKQMNAGDYMVLDFDKTTHQIVKNKAELTPRILLKIHYIVCENGDYSDTYIDTVKNIYIYNQFMARYAMRVGTNPETLYQFFWGLGCQYFMNDYTMCVILSLMLIIILVLKFVFHIKLIFKNWSKITKYVLLSLGVLYLCIVLFYWGRYQLLGIR